MDNNENKKDEFEITDQEDMLIKKLVDLELNDDGIYDLFAYDIDSLPELSDDDELK